MKVFLDTNIFYNILFETQLTMETRRILKEYADAEYMTSFIVVNELLYISTFKYYRDKGFIKGKLSLRKILEKHGYPQQIIDGVKGLLKDLGVIVLRDRLDLEELIDVITKYNLLPNDAQIAITCKYYNINTIATFDKDFKRIPWLKTIP